MTSKDTSGKIIRFTAFAVFPALLGLAAIGHLYSTRFSGRNGMTPSCSSNCYVRGVFVVLISLYGNYMLSKGYGKRLFIIEVVKDSTIIALGDYCHDMDMERRT